MTAPDQGRRQSEPAGTVIVRGGIVVYASEGAAALAGRGVGELVGRAFAELVAPEQRAMVEDLHQRRLRGEPAATRYEVALALPGAGRRLVEVHLEQDGGDLLVHLRDLAVREVRRLRLDAVATLGAALQREVAEDAIHARVRDGLWALGLASALIRAEPDGVRVVWARVPAAVSERFLAIAGVPLDGYLARWTELSRRVWSDGAQFTEDLGLHAARAVPEALAEEVRSLVNAAALSKAAAVRLGERADADLYAIVAGDWLRGEDLPAVRLFASQLAAALDAARRVADLSRRNADLAALNRVAELAAAATDLSGFLPLASEVLRAATGCAGTAVYVLDEAAGALVLAHLDGAPPDAAAPLRRIGLGGPAGRIFREGGPLVADVAAGELPELQPLGFPAIAWIPLLVRSKGVGVLAAAFRAPPSEVRARLDLLAAVGAHLASAIESHRLVADLRGRVEELSLLNDMGRTVAASLDLDRVLHDGAEAARRLVGASRGFVVLHDAVRSELRVGGGAGAPAALAGLAAPLDAVPFVAAAIRGRRPVVVADGEGAPAPDAPAARGFGRSAVAAPVLLRGEPVGAVVVDEIERARTFTPSEVERLTAVANQLALAIGNARLYAETRRRAEELGLMHEVGRALAETLDFERVLHAGVRNLARIVDAPEGYLAIVSPDGPGLEIRAAAGRHPELVGTRLPLEPPDHNLMAAAFHAREPVLVEDGAVDPRPDPTLRAQTGGRGYLGLPLVVRDRAIGALLIVETRRPRAFTVAEVERAAGIANQLAVAADNARLYEDLRRSYADLERAQHRLIQGERLAALGEMSAVVAHEVRNPLGVIFNSLGSLRRLVRPSGDAKMLLDIVGEEADRLNRIVGDLLDFARPATPELRPEPLDRVVEDAVVAALAQRPNGIDVARELDPALPAVPMDPRLVRQAVLNVVVNAVQAMPEGGRITLRTRAEREEAVLEVEDTGPGIPDEVRARIFEPFFTTKASGTGLGLAVVRRIVEGHGGTVVVRSRPGEGTLFALRFPLGRAVVEKRPSMG
ncbi:MAG TPA: GAF domain-containing protein [Anaeromyxobacter sp.]|nr:GAF domain-containing protein [Anaeromyxobacter sp.]